MQRILIAVAILEAGGIITAFVSSQIVPRHEAGAAPTAQQVREQNLDGSGFIRVHEQSTANVNVTNGSLPVSGTVNVGNLPDGRVTLVADNVTVGPGGFRSDWVDTTDCSRITVFVDPPASPSLQLSADGTTVSAAIGAGHSINGSIYYFDLTDSLSVVAPKAAVAFGGPGVVNKAWLFCSP